MILLCVTHNIMSTDGPAGGAAEMGGKGRKPGLAAIEHKHGSIFLSLDML
jgi:hypothetical protein